MESDEENAIPQAIGELERLVADGRKVPLVDQVRIDAGDLRAAVARVDEVAGLGAGGFDGDFRRALSELEGIAAEAKPIPLTGDVRCGPEELFASIDALKASVPPASGPDDGGRV